MPMTHERNKKLLLNALDYLYEIRAEWMWKRKHSLYTDELEHLDNLITDIEVATDE